MGMITLIYTIHHEDTHSRLHVSIKYEQSKLMIRIFIYSRLYKLFERKRMQNSSTYKEPLAPIGKLLTILLIFTMNKVTYKMLFLRHSNFLIVHIR